MLQQYSVKYSSYLTEKLKSEILMMMVIQSEQVNMESQMRISQRLFMAIQNIRFVFHQTFQFSEQ